jgi:multidrug efflux pump subunit AcrB
VVAPRINGDLRRPEVVITPRLDLAASLGVNTSSLSQAIRIATIGDIDQNAAKFSLSDRQVPIRVRMPESARTSLSNITNMPVPTASGDRCRSAAWPTSPSVRGRRRSSATIRHGASSSPPICRPA